MATHDLTFNIPAASSLVAGDILNCPYSGTYKTIELPSGTYQLQCWGAQGGSYSSSYYGGKGGYAIGTIVLNKKSTVYLYAGGQGTSVTNSVTGGAGGFNGGGNGGNGSNASRGIAGSGGGGASDIRINSTDLTSRVIVAGGGGGSSGPGCYGSSSLYASTAAIGGAAGIAGNDGGQSQYHGKAGGAGTTSGGGAGGAVTTASVSQADSTYYAGGGGGGGAGYYGGGGGGGGSLSSSSCRGKAGSAGTLGTGGAGGASYSSGGTAYYGSGGGSGGGGSSWTSSNLTSALSSNGNASFVDYSGSTVTGHSGNGSCRITVIKINSIPFRLKTDSTTWKECASAWIKIDSTTWKEIKSAQLKLENINNNINYIDYIESSGTQYIDTGFVPNQDTRMIIKAICPIGSTNFLFGARTSSSSNQFMFAGSASGYYTTGYGATQETYSTDYNSDSAIVIDKNKQTTTLTLSDGTSTSVSGTYTTFTAPCNLVLFGCNTNGTVAKGKVSIFNCQIYDNNVLVRDFYPCLDPDGVACLYDKVNQQYYYNAGTGTFIAGPEITGWSRI